MAFDRADDVGADKGNQVWHMARSAFFDCSEVGGAARQQRVMAVEPQLALRCRSLAGFGEGDIGVWAKPKIVLPIAASCIGRSMTSIRLARHGGRGPFGPHGAHGP